MDPSTADGQEGRRAVRLQKAVADLGRLAQAADDLEGVLHDASAAVAEALGVEQVGVLERRPDGEAVLRAGVGWDEDVDRATAVATDEQTLVGAALASDEAVVGSVGAEEGVDTAGVTTVGPTDATGPGTGVAATVGVGDDPWGVLVAYAITEGAFADADVAFLESAATVLGSAVERIDAERRLQEEESLKEQIVETTPVGITVVGPDGEMRFVNERAEEILGRERGEVMRYTYDDARWGLVDDDGEPLTEGETPFEQVISTGEPVYDMELGLLHPEGERVWITVNGAPLSTDGGESAHVGGDGGSTTGDAADGRPDAAGADSRGGAVFALADVTEQKRLESEFEELLGRVTDAFYALDDEFRFTHVNERAAELLQRPAAELLGESLWDAFPEAAEIDEVVEAFHTALNEQESTSYELYFEPLDFWVEANLYPSETGVSVYFRDISEHKEREQELERYRALTEAANDVIVTIDADSTIRSVNPAVEDVFGYEPSALVGESLTTLMEAEHAERHRASLDRYLETGEKRLDWNYVEVPGRHADGSTVPLTITFSEVVYEDERFFTGVVRDVTEREDRKRRLEAANERLTQSNERLEQFAYAASHDLKEPLRMVSGYLELLEQTHGDELDEAAAGYIESAVEGAERMREMIEALLSYSRVETDDAAMEPVDLETVLDDVRRDLAARIQETDAEVAAEPLPQVVGDGNQLRQLLQNLLDNAITYAGDAPPRVEVGAERDGDERVISVADEGIGIPPDDQESVFEVFHRLHTRDEYDGTGLGLALCRRIVERHGGEIWVDSEPGEGSTFSFTLQAAADHDG